VVLPEETDRIEAMAFEHLEAPLRRVGAIDTPVPHAPAREDAFMPQPSDTREALEATAKY
jgi:pyruvate dehydrogenase E1 component beta subunit